MRIFLGSPRRLGCPPVFAIAGLCMLCVTGCYTQEQYNQVLQRSADLQMQLDQTKASLATKAEELKAEQTKAAELVTAREKAVRAIGDTANENQQLRKNIDAARRELGAATSLLEKEHAELQKALDSQKEARSRMEQELADRDRQIDILTSKVRRLEREIEGLKKEGQPTAGTQPSR